MSTKRSRPPRRRCRELLPVDAKGVGRRAGDDHARIELLRERAHLVVVDFLGRVEAVGNRAKELSGEVHRRPVREVAAVRERHAENGVARLEVREIHGLVRLRTRVRLHVRVLGAEELLRALDRRASATSTNSHPP
jgi:hypothetical protein